MRCMLYGEHKTYSCGQASSCYAVEDLIADPFRNGSFFAKRGQ